ncbi:MAG: SIS domain-containing protein [Acidimicrobiia bacterium]
MADLVAGLPDQLRWGLDLDPVPLPPADHVVILGMGGSGMAGRLAAMVAARGPAVVQVHPDYGLPGWVIPNRALVVAVSYSGNTAETLTGLTEAVAAGLPVAVVSTGGEIGALAVHTGIPSVTVPAGMQPRAALGHLVAATLSILAAAGVIPDPSADLSAAADTAEHLLADGNGPGWALGTELGEALVDRIPLVIGGSGPAAMAAGRWATQFNENAKRAAFAALIPEMNHNALEALAAGVPEPGRLGVVGLLDPAGVAANDRRIRLTLDRLGPTVARTGEVVAQGKGILERAVSLIAVGDVASVALAERIGVDPVPVDALEGFKRSLQEG